MDFDDQPFNQPEMLFKRLIYCCVENKADKVGRNWCLDGEAIFCY